jgi:hypothetical protein
MKTDTTGQKFSYLTNMCLCAQDRFKLKQEASHVAKTKKQRLKTPMSNDHMFITLSLSMKFKPKSKFNHVLKNDITTIMMDNVLFFHTPKLESYIVPNV